MAISLDSVVVRTQTMPGTELEGAMVFLSVESGDYLRLDGTARAIWDALERPISVSDLVANLAAQYGIEPSDCAKDVLPFLEELLGCGLVVSESVAK